jgi:cyclohexanecarboxylate-CoA ligase
MWELTERRADASPDHPMLIAADGETVTFGEFRQRASGWRPACTPGESPGLSGVVAVADPDRHVVLSMALSRLGAVQNPIIHLYREREIGFALARPVPPSSSSPPPGGTPTSWPWPSGPWRVPPRPPTILTIDDGLPEGDPATLPPPPGDDARGRPHPLDLLHLGLDGRPQGVQHTDQTLIAGGWGLARALAMNPDDVGSIAFPFAHIAGPDYLVTMLSFGFPAILVEAFSAPDVLPLFRRHGATMVGGSTAFYVAYLAEQRKTPEEPILPTLRLMSGGGRPSRPRSTTRCATRSAAGAWCTATA